MVQDCPTTIHTINVSEKKYNFFCCYFQILKFRSSVRVQSVLLKGFFYFMSENTRKILCGHFKNFYLQQYRDQKKRPQLVYSFLGGPGRNRVFVHFDLSKRPINQFKPVQQSKQQALRAYCPNIYTVPFGPRQICQTLPAIWHREHRFALGIQDTCRLEDH